MNVPFAINNFLNICCKNHLKKTNNYYNENTCIYFFMKILKSYFEIQIINNNKYFNFNYLIYKEKFIKN